ncbi:MAG: ATP phosphoribosyltransferase regulatory subunit [Pseudomonadales bacterium]
MTKTAERWQLPDGIEELLPQQASRVEHVRRQLLDLYAHWGYQFVMPPLLEFTESLLVGLGEDLDLQTFKVIDQHTGRMLGIRADITPQTARIDAHSIAAEGVQRLCYAGSVLRAKPSGIKASRAPIQVGAELYGVTNVSADVEVISLMLTSLETLGISDLTLDLGHVGIYRSLVEDAGLNDIQQQDLFSLLQNKSYSELQTWLASNINDTSLAKQLSGLAGLNGGADVVTAARKLSQGPKFQRALDDLAMIAKTVQQRFPNTNLYFDLSELRGYNYHTGLVFAAYVPGVGRALANGGRYDDIGAAFGRARAATGFNADLKTLLSIGREPAQAVVESILAPVDEDPELWSIICQLRASGATVVSDLDQAGSGGFTRVLVKDNNGQWQVQPNS